MENKSDKYITEFVESEDEDEEEFIEDQTIDDQDLITIQIEDVETITEPKEKTILFNGFLINITDIPVLKNEYLLRYNYDEVIGILLNTYKHIQHGASIIIDEIEFEKITNEKFYNNYNVINEKTVSIISIILKCMPIHIEKNNKMYDRFNDISTIEYLYYIKKILLILKQNNRTINFNIIKKLFPKLFYNIYYDNISNDEMTENQNIRKLLLKIN